MGISALQNRGLRQLLHRRRGGSSALTRFSGDCSGTSAVEFSILAIPFMATLFAVLETALVMFASLTLETATADAARLIRTGQAQEQGFTATEFRQRICDSAFFGLDCNNKLHVDVRTYDEFGVADLSIPMNENGLQSDQFVFSAGSGGDIIVARAYYEWPIIVRGLGYDLTNMPNGTRLLVATAAFRNEPFPW